MPCALANVLATLVLLEYSELVPNYFAWVAKPGLLLLLDLRGSEIHSSVVVIVIVPVIFIQNQISLVVSEIHKCDAVFD